MAGLTVTEKEHGKERISSRIDKKIDAIVAQDPAYMERIRREARERACVSLGIADLQAERCAVAKQKEAAEKREGQIEREMMARIQGVPPEAIEEPRYYSGFEAEIEEAVQKSPEGHKEEL